MCAAGTAMVSVASEEDGMTYDPEFNFEEAPYVFAFRPEMDDFSVVQFESATDRGGIWELSEEHPFVGSHCLECIGNPEVETDAFVFSRAFKFVPGVDYTAVIYYRGGGDLLSEAVKFSHVEGVRSKNNAHLTLWLCSEQDSSSRIRRLAENGIAHDEYQYMRADFSVDREDVYYFGGEAVIAPSDARVAMGMNGLVARGTGASLDDWLYS